MSNKLGINRSAVSKHLKNQFKSIGKPTGSHRNNPYVMDIENDDDVMLAAECPLGTE